MAKPYQHGKGWAVRLRINGQDIFLSGYKTEAAARKAAEAEKARQENVGKPSRLGPHRTSLAVALQDYARERLPYLKGARQDAQRMNVYLRACNLPVICLEKMSAESGADSKEKRYRHVTQCRPLTYQEASENPTGYLHFDGIFGGIGQHRDSTSSS